MGHSMPDKVSIWVWLYAPQIWVLAFVAFFFLSGSKWSVEAMNQGGTP